MKAHADKFNIVKMAKILEVTPSGYYGYCSRNPSKRALNDVKILANIKAIPMSAVLTTNKIYDIFYDDFFNRVLFP